MSLFDPTVPERLPRRILIANRGEIALRVINACKDLGLTSIAIFADDDMEAPFVRHATEAYSLGAGGPGATYLNIEKILTLASEVGAEAIHPGYGFLSERADFARAVIDAGLTWIGPSAEVIEQLGNKITARDVARKVGAPLVAGTDGPISDPQEAIQFARQHGLPVVIKAAHGGGGRGMKVAYRLEDVAELFQSATQEAITAFGRGECFVEQFIDRPRHVEVQILADRHGTVKVLGTRDCSMQRRNQKLIEEAPAPFLTPEQRDDLHQSAQRICAEVGYQGAATVEFLLSNTGLISFLEVNTRLQVEHCVTEEVTGIDIVTAMIRIAGGAKLQNADLPQMRGHAIEFRINAEDPARGFLPAPGKITLWQPPSGPGVRLDSGVEQGSAVSGRFDSMLAKLIITGPDRATAIARARRALSAFRVEGVPTVLPFARLAIEQEAFQATGAEGFSVHTRWIETDFAETLEKELVPAPLPASANGVDMRRLPIQIDGRWHEIALPEAFLSQSFSSQASSTPTATLSGDDAEDGECVRAPIAGTVARWQAEDGAEVTAGQTIAILEAMKMEIAVTAEANGKLRQLVAAGATVAAEAVVARITT